MRNGPHRLRTKIRWILLAASAGLFLPGLTVGYLAARSILVEEAYAQIRFAAEAVDQSFDEWINSTTDEARYLLGTTDIRSLGDGAPASSRLRALAEARPWIKDVYLLTIPGGLVAASSHALWEGQYLNLSEVYTKGSRGLMVTKVYPFPLDLEPTITVAAPVSPNRIAAFNLKLDQLEAYRQMSRSLGSAARIYLVNANREPVSSQETGLSESPRGLYSRAVEGLEAGSAGSGAYRDHRGVPVLGEWRPLSTSGLGLIVELEESEALMPSTWLGILFLLLAAAALGLSGLVAARLAAPVTQPLEALTQTALTLTRGNWDVAWPAETPDEVGTLNRTLRAMTEALIRNSQVLEQRVDERTSALQQTILELEGTRNQLVDSGKMAMLGTLVAGISHELNTPLGAIVSSAQFIRDSVSGTWGQTLAAVRELEGAAMETFHWLLASAGQAGAFSIGSEHRNRVQKLRQQLEGQGLDADQGLLDRLADLGIESVPAGHAGFFRSPQAEAVLKEIWKIASLDRSVRVIDEAAQRASRVLLSLRIYARQDQEGPPVPTDLAPELDMLLDIYYPSLKRGVEVVRDYQPVGPVVCHRDRLNQVWANLINNALHAMGGSGRLVLAIRGTGDTVDVSVTDNGPGIGPEHRDRIFTPFFTTKKAGEGTGLGLSISRGIIEEHGGTLTFDSRPGKTTFTVRLPAAPSRRAGPADR